MTGKTTKLEQAKLLLISAPHGLTDNELAEALEIDRMSAHRYRKELGAIPLTRSRYTLRPNPNDITLARTILEQTNNVSSHLSNPYSDHSNRSFLYPPYRRLSSMFTIAIANEKGGVGKTTLSTHLGSGLALHGFRTLVIDLDTQAHASLSFGIPKTPRLYDLLVRDADWGDVVVEIPSATYLPPGTDPNTVGTLALLPGHVETRNIPPDINSDTLRRRLSQLTDVLDVVLIDCGPTATLISSLTYIAADAVLLPSLMEAWSIDGIKETFKRIRDTSPSRAQLKLPELATLGIVPTMYRDNSEHKDNLNDLKARYGDLIWPEIRQRVIWSISARHRHMIFAHETNTPDLIKARAEIWSLIERLEKELPHVATA